MMGILSSVQPGGQTDGISAPILPCVAMGLKFQNQLGLAAGFDRTGAQIPSLLSSGFGHVEIGTIKSAAGYAGPPSRPLGGARLGINIGSGRYGIDEIVIGDYLARLRQAAPAADYIVANLSAPTVGRNGSSDGVERLIQSLSAERDALSHALSRRLPLLVKIEGGEHEVALPTVLASARQQGLDGVVLVSDCLQRLRAISASIAPLAVISVGGVRTAADLQARLAAGAALVQVHSAFAAGGMAEIHRLFGKTPTQPSAERRS